MNQHEKLTEALKSLEAYKECHLVPSYFLNALADIRAILAAASSPLPAEPPDDGFHPTKDVYEATKQFWPAEPPQPEDKQVCKCGLPKNDPIHSYTTEWQQMHTFTPKDATAAEPPPAAAHRCPHCGRRMVSEFDEDVSFWRECANCDYREQVSSAPAEPEGEREQWTSDGCGLFRNGAWVTSTAVPEVAATLARKLNERATPPETPSDAAMRAADAIADYVSDGITGMGNEVTETNKAEFLAIITRYLGTTPAKDERETLIYWLLRCYESGHRQGWEPGSNTDETMDGLLSVLANRGYDPKDNVAKELLKQPARY